MEMRGMGRGGKGKEGREKDPPTIIIIIYAPAMLQHALAAHSWRFFSCLCPGQS